ncbi:MAG: YdcF family protein [Polyangiaceae bacterium]
MSLVLLGCRVVGPAALSATSARRADRALQAFRSGVSGHLLACGGKAWNGVREADALCAYLIERGMPEQALERELWSHSTRQNAHFAARLLLPRGLRRIGLVTCDWHMQRALKSFVGAGFEVEAMPAVTPAVALGDEWKRAVRERLALAVDSLVTRGFSRV